MRRRVPTTIGSCVATAARSVVSEGPGQPRRLRTAALADSVSRRGSAAAAAGASAGDAGGSFVFVAADPRPLRSDSSIDALCRDVTCDSDRLVVAVRSADPGTSEFVQVPGDLGTHFVAPPRDGEVCPVAQVTARVNLTQFAESNAAAADAHIGADADLAPAPPPKHVGHRRTRLRHRHPHTYHHHHHHHQGPGTHHLCRDLQSDPEVAMHDAADNEASGALWADIVNVDEGAEYGARFPSSMVDAVAAADSYDGPALWADMDTDATLAAARFPNLERSVPAHKTGVDGKAPAALWKMRADEAAVTAAAHAYSALWADMVNDNTVAEIAGDGTVAAPSLAVPSSTVSAVPDPALWADVTNGPEDARFPAFYTAPGTVTASKASASAEKASVKMKQCAPIWTTTDAQDRWAEATATSSLGAASPSVEGELWADVVDADDAAVNREIGAALAAPVASEYPEAVWNGIINDGSVPHYTRPIPAPPPVAARAFASIRPQWVALEPSTKTIDGAALWADMESTDGATAEVAEELHAAALAAQADHYDYLCPGPAHDDSEALWADMTHDTTSAVERETEPSSSSIDEEGFDMSAAQPDASSVGDEEAAPRTPAWTIAAIASAAVVGGWVMAEVALTPFTPVTLKERLTALPGTAVSAPHPRACPGFLPPHVEAAPTEESRVVGVSYF